MRSLVLELGPEGAVSVCAVVVRKKRKPEPLKTVTHVIGRDVGDRNTVTHSVLALEGPLDPARVTALAARTMAEAAAFVATHAVDGEPRFVERVGHNCKAFLACTQRHADRIAQLSARIDAEYAALDRESDRLAALLRQMKDEHGRWPHVARDEVPRGHPARPALGAFFRRLTHIDDLKRARRERYRRIRAVRKSWLGFLANAEVLLVLK